MKTSLKLYFTALVASFLLLLGACSTNSSTSQTETSSSAPTEVTIKSSLAEVKLSKVPEKIVTFDLGAADTIRALGFEKNIVGMPTKTVPTYLKDLVGTVNPNHSYLSQLDVTYKTPDLMSHFLPPHEVSFTFCCSSIVFPR